MPAGKLDSFINFIIPPLLVIIAVVFVWWKASEPLKKFWELIRGMFSSGTDKTFEAVAKSKEIVYDI